MNESDFFIASKALAYRFQEAHITQTSLSSALSIPQSQISRVLGGKTKKPGTTYLRLCNYANSKLGYVDNKEMEIPSELLRAIEDVWDGSLEHARALATVIRSLRVLKPQYLPENQR